VRVKLFPMERRNRNQSAEIALHCSIPWLHRPLEYVGLVPGFESRTEPRGGSMLSLRPVMLLIVTVRHPLPIHTCPMQFQLLYINADVPKRALQ
jgi:hypothetical protein